MLAVPAPVEHGQAGVEGGPASGIGPAVNGHGEDDAGRGIETLEGVLPDPVPGHAARRGDGHEPAPKPQHGEGRAQVAQVSVMADAMHPRTRGERRVHEHHGRPDVRETVGDGLGVEPGHRGFGEEPGQEAGPGPGDLVQMERAFAAGPEGALGHDGEDPGPGAGFEHDVAGPDGGRLQGRIGEAQGRGELLEPDLGLGSLRVGGLQGRDLLQQGQHGGRAAGSGPAAHGPAVALQEEHDGRFGGLVGVLPDPGPLGVGGPEGLGHGLAEGGRVERPAGCQYRQQGLGRGEQGGRGHGRNGPGGVWTSTRTLALRRRQGVGHGGSSPRKSWKSGAGGGKRPPRLTDRPGRAKLGLS